jgi:hypothetical protein
LRKDWAHKKKPEGFRLRWGQKQLLFIARPIQPVGKYKKAQQTKQQDGGHCGFHIFSLGK